MARDREAKSLMLGETRKIGPQERVPVRRSVPATLSSADGFRRRRRREAASALTPMPSVPRAQ
eukprot:1415219-Pyramimonas_sp.AAC.1